MADERQRTQPTPEQEARRNARRASQQRRRRNSVFQYIAILFMAAFVLLLYTYLMERRQNQQQIDDLQRSVSAAQSLENLYKENAQLKDSVSQLEDQLKELEVHLAAAEQAQADTQSQAQDKEKVVEAMTWFWELNDSYVRGRLTDCRNMITSMEEAGLDRLLPQENPTGTSHLSPAGRYEEIHKRVVK